MDKNSQCDNAIDLKRNGIETFLDIVRMACTINYFQIAYCLQCEVAKQISFIKLYFYTIGLAFGTKDLTRFSKESHKQIWDSSKFDFYACIEQLKTKIKFNPTTNTSNQTDLIPQQIKSVANYLTSTEYLIKMWNFANNC